MPQLPFTFRAQVEAEKPAPSASEPDSSTTETEPESHEEPHIYGVSELARALREHVEARFRFVLVTGEISGLQVNARSGHAYFTLKDRGAQLRCVMWREHRERLRFEPRDGQEVLARAKATVYPKSGSLQLGAFHLEPRGLGALQLEYQQRIEKLRAEGLTDPDRKRPLPVHPDTIGVVTSREGAALRDILRTIYRRDPFARVLISTCQVQGRAAASEVVQALRRLDRLRRCDVVIVARGGGSVEDLWGFNEEKVARAIVASHVPVITGIGHETDTTIADLVADHRASTPTAAAERTVPVRSEWRARWQILVARLHRSLRHSLAHQRARLLGLDQRLRSPTAGLRRQAQLLDELELRAERALRRRVQGSTRRLRELEFALVRTDPRERLRQTSHRFRTLEARLLGASRAGTARRRARLGLAGARLAALSPLAVLGRGYALARSAEGRLVREASALRPGDTLEIRFARSRARALVLSTESKLDPDDSA